MLKHFSITPPKNFGGAEKSTENSGSHAKNFFCSMYEMSQRHPVWVTENHVNPCNSVEFQKSWCKNVSGKVYQGRTVKMLVTEIQSVTGCLNGLCLS